MAYRLSANHGIIRPASPRMNGWRYSLEYLKAVEAFQHFENCITAQSQSAKPCRLLGGLGATGWAIRGRQEMVRCRRTPFDNVLWAAVEREAGPTNRIVNVSVIKQHETAILPPRRGGCARTAQGRSGYFPEQDDRPSKTPEDFAATPPCRRLSMKTSPSRRRRNARRKPDGYSRLRFPKIENT